MLLILQEGALTSIMGEINTTDTFGKIIIDTIKQYNLTNNLEIGSWDGTGSTQCFIEGMKDLSNPQLTCLEVRADRFQQLVNNTQKWPWVKCVNNSTISFKSFIYKNFDEIWNSPYNKIQNTRDIVESWYRQDIDAISNVTDGFLETDHTFYDGVLIDGGEFFGYSEFLLIKDRCNVLFLDDYYGAFKTRQVAEELSADSDWEAIAGEKFLRNGFAVFKRKVFKCHG